MNAGVPLFCFGPLYYNRTDELVYVAQIKKFLDCSLMGLDTYPDITTVRDLIDGMLRSES